MPRSPRIQFENAFYHITSRGIEARKIFIDDKDKLKFIQYLKDDIKKFDILLYAYVLMDNHYHLLIETKKPNLSRFMQHLHTSYTVYFNLRHGRVGHLFQGRYKSIIVEKESYLLELVRYIVLNPVRAGMLKNPFKYRWSSLSSYLSGEDFVYTDWIEDYFGSNWKKGFIEFIKDGIKMKSPFRDLKKGFILGSDNFVKVIAHKIEFGQKRVEKGVDFEDIIKGVCDYFGVKEGEIKMRKREYLPRRIAMYFAYRFTDKSLKELGEYFNVSADAVKKNANRIEKEVKNKKDVKTHIEKVKRIIFRD